MKTINILDGQFLPSFSFVVTNSEGEVLRSGTAPLDMVPAQANAGETAYAGSLDMANQYVDVATGKIANKQRIALVTVGNILSNLPAGAIVIADTLTLTEQGGAVDLSPLAAGTYTVLIRAKHYFDEYIQFSKA